MWTVYLFWILAEAVGPAPIGEDSSIKLGLVISVVGFCVGAVWWAAALQTKVNNLLQIVTASKATEEKNRNDIAQLDKRVAVLEEKD